MNHCCKLFPEIIDQMDWFQWTDKNDRVMPVLRDTPIRVNHCPSCGEYIRNIQINADGDRIA